MEKKPSGRQHLAALESAVQRLYPGEVVALVVVGAYLLFLVASAATAPPVDVGRASNETTTLVGIQGPFRDANGYAVVLGPDGRTQWRSPEAWAHFDVDRLRNGRILAAFMVRHQQNCGRFDPPCARTGFRIYAPSKADPVVREWTYPVRTHVNSEVHDADMLPNGNVVVAGMEYERVFVVNQSGAIVWQWNASTYYDAPPQPTRTDWLHINDVDHLGDDRFLVSVRNANQLLIINRQKEILEVVNADSDPAVLSKQHNPQYLGPNRILVADSHNDRVVELRQNASGEWYVAWQLRRAGGVPFNWPRDADLLANGHVLVTDTFNHRVVEVTRNGTVVWSTSTRPIPYEADRNGTEYPPALRNGTSTRTYTQSQGPSGPSTPAIPLLSDAYVGFVGTLSPPYWFRFVHFLGLLVASFAGLGGLASSVTNRLR